LIKIRNTIIYFGILNDVLTTINKLKNFTFLRVINQIIIKHQTWSGRSKTMLHWTSIMERGSLPALPEELVESMHQLVHMADMTDYSYLQEIFDDYDVNTYFYGISRVPFIFDCILADNIDALRLAVSCGMDIDQANLYHRKALHLACTENKLAITKYLLSLGFHHVTEMEKVQIFQKCDFDIFAALRESGIGFSELLSNAQYLVYDHLAAFRKDERKLTYLLQEVSSLTSFHRILDLSQKWNPLMLLIHRYGQLREVDVAMLEHLCDLIRKYIVCFQFDFDYCPPGRTDGHSTLTFFLSTIRPCFNNPAHHKLVTRMVDLMVKKGGASAVMAERFMPINRALQCRCQACVFASVIPSRCVRFPLNIR
jgi:hypothetical protein